MVKKPVRSIVAAIASAAARWSDAAFAPRVRARDAASARTGYSPAAVDFAFDTLFGALRKDAIEAVVTDELGCLDVLDGFVERSGRPPTRALPIGRVCIVSSRTTVGVAIVPAVFALCAKCDVEVKDRDDALVAAFFETLAGELPELRDAARARVWDGETGAQSLHGFDAVVAFGNDATLAAISTALPYPARFVAYGSKASAGYVACDALASEEAARALARAAARDLVLYDTEGCLSLHALFVENGGAVSPQAFTAILADAIGDAAREFGGPARDDVAARRAAARDLVAFRGDARVYSPTDAGYLAVLDPPLDERPAFLPLTIGVRSVDRPSQAAEYLERHGIAVEALAVAPRRPDLVTLAERVGASRVARFGSLQTPPLGGFHGGRPRIAEFVRWMVDEA